eukprot:TRINITY_DN42076_c0_g1_i1.p1 TRINITY_DN42076_c0_g1~~TRINITY_DN42076_c0_g1_i1.p1  ORF type:complete len:240 (-),score=18.39 TRINITY_DN42076_c0_g1_i1:41-739(-)
MTARCRTPSPASLGSTASTSTPPPLRLLCSQNERMLSRVSWRHPCPRQRHHPGEQCGCAKRLDVRVPHGYSRRADLGSVHDMRVLNLRWRLSSGAIHARHEELPLPASLCTLAEDHRGDAGARSIRPLEPSTSSAPVKPSLASNASLENRRSSSHVSFSDQSCEVPIMPSSKELACKRERTLAEDNARAYRHLHALASNHKRIGAEFQKCFSFLTACLTSKQERSPHAVCTG